MRETNANLSGRLAEQYVLETFGVREDQHHEIKAFSKGTGYVLVRVLQIGWSMGKVFWCLEYCRDRYAHKVTRGPRKNRVEKKPRLTIREAFEQKRVRIAVATGAHLMAALARIKKPVQARNDRERGPHYYWRLTWEEIVHDCRPIQHRGVEVWKHYDLHPERLEPTPIQLTFVTEDELKPAPEPGVGLFDDEDIPF